jgi:hypothetical protein
MNCEKAFGQPLIGGLLYALCTALIIGANFTLIFALRWEDRLIPLEWAPIVALAILFWVVTTIAMYGIAVENYPRSEAHLSLLAFQALRWTIFFSTVWLNNPADIILAWSIELIIFLVGCIMLIFALIYQGCVSCRKQLKIEYQYIKNAS